MPFFPHWSPLAPEHTVYASNESGVWQVHAWDVSTGTRRQVSESSVGVTDGTPTLDGEGVLWFDDETGDESGRWLVQPFAGGETRPFLEGVPHGWNEGLAQAPGIVAARDQRPRRLRRLRRQGRRARPRVRSFAARGADREQRRGRLPARRPLRRRDTPLRRALRARRRHPCRHSAFSTRGPARRRATSSTKACPCSRSAGRRSRAISGSPSSTSARGTSDRGYGISRPAPAPTSRSTSRAAFPCRTGGRTPLHSSSGTCSRGAATCTATSSRAAS